MVLAPLVRSTHISTSICHILILFFASFDSHDVRVRGDDVDACWMADSSHAIGVWQSSRWSCPHSRWSSNGSGSNPSGMQ
jgi:hypothetical protein